MSTLVWIDHGEVSVLQGDWKDMKTKVVDVLKFYYSKEDIDYVNKSHTQFEFENRVRNTCVDDEMFETFEFVRIEEI